MQKQSTKIKLTGKHTHNIIHVLRIVVRKEQFWEKGVAEWAITGGFFRRKKFIWSILMLY